MNPALYLFPLPAVAIIAFFLVMPTLQAFQYAVTDWNGFSAAFNYVGVDNFVRAFTKDSLFTNALTNNLKFVLLVVIAQTVFSLLLALLLTKNSRGNVVLRALFFFPTILSSVSVAFIWKFIYDPNFGLANSALGRRRPGRPSGVLPRQQLPSAVLGGRDAGLVPRRTDDGGLHRRPPGHSARTV